MTLDGAASALATRGNRKRAAKEEDKLEGAKSPIRCTLLLWRRFWWESPLHVRSQALLRLAAVVLVQLVRGKASAFLSSERRRQVDIMLKAGGVDRHGILLGMVRYLIALLVLSPVNTTYWRLLRALRQQWNAHLTKHFLTSFVEAQCLTYGASAGSVEHSDSTHENDGCGDGSGDVSAAACRGVHEDRLPDQRIAHDVGTFVTLSTSLSLEAMQALIHMYFYASLLREISPLLSRSAVCTAVVGTLTTRWLGRSLPTLYAAERNADGDFVYSLTRTRENAESIAFYGGQQLEVSRLSSKLSHRLNTEWRRFARKDVVQLFSAAYRQVASLLPVYILVDCMDQESHGHGHQHGHGHGQGQVHGVRSKGTNLGVVNQAREAFDDTLYHLLILAENTSDFSRLATVAHELHFYDLQSRQVLKQLQQQRDDAGAADQQISLQHLSLEEQSSGERSWLQIERLSMWAPGMRSKPLVSDLSLSLGKGGMLINGPSGVGKTTLLRAVAGLWLRGSGVIRRDMDPRYILFLPQQPYMQIGTLREQLLYPFGSSAQIKDDGDLSRILTRLDLAHILDRVAGDFGACKRWADELSVGEQQRISVARVLVHQPAFAILDETTAANDLAHERIMYECIAETCDAFLSVGHRASIEAFHRRRLTLFGELEDGRWQLENICK